MFLKARQGLGFGLAIFIGTFLSISGHIEAQSALFQDGFESGDSCRWSISSEPGNCPPRFGGILWAYPGSIDTMSLAWLPAEDDQTVRDDLVYDVHLSTDPDFVPTPDTLALSVVGATDGVLVGLNLDTTYFVLVVVEDQEGAVSRERDHFLVRTPALTEALGDVPFQRAEDLELGEPIAADETSLTFARTAQAILPTIGTLLVGPFADGGYLRTVLGVTTTATTIEVDTEGGIVADAFDQADFGFFAILHESTGTNVVTRKGLEGTPVAVQTAIDFEPQVGVRAAWTTPLLSESGEIRVQGNLALDTVAAIDFAAAGTFEPDPVLVLQREWWFESAIGSLPIYQRITLEAELQVSVTATTAVRTEFSTLASADLVLGLRYDPATQGWQAFSSREHDDGVVVSLDVPGVLDGDLQLETKVRVEVFESEAASIETTLRSVPFLTIEDSGVAQCAPSQISRYVLRMLHSCFGDLDFAVFAEDFPTSFGNLCTPYDLELFSLPEVELVLEGGGPGGGLLGLEVLATDGDRNPWTVNSVLWQIDPDDGNFVVDGIEPPTAQLTCSDEDFYEVVFSSHGVLGEPARRCLEVQHRCGGCMTGPWLDDSTLEWDLSQTGSTVTGTVLGACGGIRTVSGALEGSAIYLETTGAPPPGCCNFAYTGTLDQCTSGAGIWENFGGTNCHTTGDWAMQRVSDSESEGGVESWPGSQLPGTSP